MKPMNVQAEYLVGFNQRAHELMQKDAGIFSTVDPIAAQSRALLNRIAASRRLRATGTTHSAPGVLNTAPAVAAPAPAPAVAHSLPPVPASTKPIISDAERLLNQAAGHKNMEDFNSNSGLARLKSRLLSGDDEIFEARRHWGNAAGGVTPNLQDYNKALENMGETVRGRLALARKIGYGGVGAAGAGTLAYGAGNSSGRKNERHSIGKETNKLMHALPLSKRLQLAFNSIFNPGGTGDQIEKTLSY